MAGTVPQQNICYTINMETSMLRFESLYERYAVEVKRFIFTICRRDSTLTDDVFQNTWVSVWRGIDTLCDQSSARAWLYTIARNEARRYFYKNRKEVVFEEFDEDEEVFDDVMSSFPDALANSDIVKRLLEKLTASEHQIVLLYYGYDMRLTDIAELFNVNYNTVKSSLRRSIAKLKRWAEKSGA